MRTTVKVLAASALAALSLVAAGATPALAAAPAPFCESGGSQFYCDGSSTETTTWTITWYSGSVGTFTAGSTLFASCPASNLGRPVRASYSYFDGSTTQYSDTTQFICRSGPWQ
ncbi:hypothetical protein FJK98_13030 [Micromonospora sp. HM134]|uniref:hypothetical protein n=1 Tax=Micromonospora sp. HM134 TaxID=2583243 RepID=UPI0011988CB9|nr:hypothetical protein [Micromonospora sp. HM134]QDY07969.1 hypothetical protein FJK98_13030 [Micromonospora sp. HM134]